MTLASVVKATLTLFFWARLSWDKVGQKSKPAAEDGEAGEGRGMG